MSYAQAVFMCVLITYLSRAAEELPLPRSLSSKAVYYVKTKQLNDFSCGYNALFNAANFESHCGFTNHVYRYEAFSQKILPYLRSQGLDPKKASYSYDTEHLAREVLDLMPFFHLQKNKNTIELMLSEKTTVSHIKGASRAQIDRLLESAVAKKRKQRIDSLKNYLEKEREAVIHFICYVKTLKGGDHIVLLSLHQNASGRGLYLFDNINESVTEASDIRAFIEYLCVTFSISSSSHYKGPTLPTRWTFLDTPDYSDRTDSSGRKSHRSLRFSTNMR